MHGQIRHATRGSRSPRAGRTGCLKPAVPQSEIGSLRPVAIDPAITMAPSTRTIRSFMGFSSRESRVGIRKASPNLYCLALHKVVTGRNGPAHVAFLARPDI